MKKVLFIMLCLPLIGFGQNWNQIGQDIDGDTTNDNSDTNNNTANNNLIMIIIS